VIGIALTPLPYLREAASTLHPRALAALGDAVYTLWVKQHLLAQALSEHQDASGKTLHTQSAKWLNAAAQAQRLEQLMVDTAFLLTEAELDWVRRGRNIPLPKHKQTQAAVHHAATGFEVLLGWWWLTDSERLAEALGVMIEVDKPLN